MGPPFADRAVGVQARSRNPADFGSCGPLRRRFSRRVVAIPSAALGETFATHPLVDMVSLTGSTAVGGVVGAAAAPSIKRVSLELGGKSANLVFADVDVARAVYRGVHECMHNSGQSCNAPTRMLVAQQVYDEAVEVAAWAADELVVGGLGRPDGLDKGFFVRPTVFADVTPEMRIFREEIFGPVLCMTPFRDEDHAVELANASEYGLSGYIQSADLECARRVAGRMRTGMVHLNGAPTDARAPFGGYKQSGNGREWGRFGLEEYLEVKAIMGYTPPGA
jgi:acyl-CoA reductase-like NAD-dependent aldehyde dehydrogenase